MLRSLVRSVLAWGTAVGGVVASIVGVPADGPTEGDRWVESAYLTGDGFDIYEFVAADRAVAVASAGHNLGRNTRMVFRPADVPVSRDHQSCATWDDVGNDLRQPGAALRIAPAGRGVRAVTVMKNIYLGSPWLFNVHVVDPDGDPVLIRLGQFDLSDTLVRDGSLVPGPWRMCARAVGDTVSFKVWPLSDPEPDWGDPAHGATVQLPPGWDGDGRPGWYIGHLSPGESASFSDLAVRY